MAPTLMSVKEHQSTRSTENLTQTPTLTPILNPDPNGKVESENNAMLAKINDDKPAALGALLTLLNGASSDVAALVKEAGLSATTPISGVKAERVTPTEDTGHKIPWQHTGGASSPEVVHPTLAHREIKITATMGASTVLITHSVFMQPTALLATALCGEGTTQARGTIYHVKAKMADTSAAPGAIRLSDGDLKLAIHYSSAENYRISGAFLGTAKVSGAGYGIAAKQLSFSAFCGRQLHKVGGTYVPVCDAALHVDAASTVLTLTSFTGMPMALGNSIMKLGPAGDVSLTTAGHVGAYESTLEVDVTIEGPDMTGRVYVLSELDLNKIASFAMLAGKAASQLPILASQSHMLIDGGVVSVHAQDDCSHLLGVNAVIEEGTFDFSARAFTIKMRSLGGPTFQVDAPNGAMASFQASETRIAMNNVMGVKIKGGATVKVAQLGEIDVMFHGGFTKTGVQLMANGNGWLAGKSVTVWVAGQDDKPAAEFMLAITFNDSIRLEDFAGLATIPGIQDMATLGKGATIAIASLPHGGASLLTSVTEAINADAIANSDVETKDEIVAALHNFGLAQIETPLSGVLVDSDSMSYDFSGELETLNSFLPHRP